MVKYNKYICNNEFKIDEFKVDLFDSLKYCIGKDTVEVRKHKYYIELYHYGAMISVYNMKTDVIIFNKRYYDYSMSTSRVRNAFTRLLYDIDTLQYTKSLQKCERINHLNEYASGFYRVYSTDNQKSTVIGFIELVNDRIYLNEDNYKTLDKYTMR